MTSFLPIFPLKLVVFPGEQLNLHIFESRYKQLIQECDNEGVNFGIAPFLGKKIGTFGTEVELVKIVRKYENGEMDITTRGKRIFKIEEFFRKAPKKLYSGADIEFVEHNTAGDVMSNIHILEKVKELFSIMKIKKDLPASPELFSTYDLAHHVGFSLNQEFDFLKVPDEKDRQRIMLQHLETLLPVVSEMEKLREKIRMNGHFRDAIPPDLLGG
ncbi:MAG: LON peptidase substrate-binding domain-containing protein [Bacteroidota bacterium]